jgi:myo-inositol-1-phosphate synthase
MDDIEAFQGGAGVTRMVMLWCGSTEILMELDDVHKTLSSFEQGLKENHPAITPSMIYAYAALMSGVPFGNGAPNLTVDIPALLDLAVEKGVPVCGKDFKTGQTLMKTILTPGLKARMLGLHGWFSTNILGNRDGDVLHDPASFRTKERSKLSVLDYILQPNLYEDLYGAYDHKVHIHYYKSRRDNKER